MKKIFGENWRLKNVASKFVRSVKDIYHLEQFNTNLVDENDILSTIDGEVYIYTKDGFLHLESIEPLQDEVQEVQEKLSDNEQRIYNNEEKIKKVEFLPDEVQEVQEKLSDNEKRIYDNEQKLDSINIDELKQEQKTLSEKIDETKNETNEKIQSNTDKINEINITDTGWQNIDITGSGLTPHTDQPQYRITTVKGIKTVALRGAVNGYKGNNITVGKIPISGEFSNPQYYVQNTSKKSGSINFIRITIKRDGNIVLEGTTYSNPDGTEWCPINNVFID